MAFQVKSEDGSTRTIATTTDAQGRDVVTHTIASPANRLTGRVTVGTNPTPIVPAVPGRVSALVKLVGDTPQAVFIGASDVTPSTGFDIPGVANASLELNGSGAIYGCVASGTQDVSFVEEF